MKIFINQKTTLKEQKGKPQTRNYRLLQHISYKVSYPEYTKTLTNQ